MDTNEKAFEYAGETVRQVLTLATGVIALTVTFAKDIIEPGSEALPWMKWGWTLFGVSIFFGILTLMAIAGNLHKASTDNSAPDMYAPNIRLFANLQIWLCFVALVLTIRFGIIGMNEASRKATTQPGVAVTCAPCPSMGSSKPGTPPGSTDTVPAPATRTTT